MASSTPASAYGATHNADAFMLKSSFTPVWLPSTNMESGRAYSIAEIDLPSSGYVEGAKLRARSATSPHK